MNPSVIEQLEKLNGFTISSTTVNKVGAAVYKVDGKGNVVQLHFHSIDGVDITPLKGLDSLVELNLTECDITNIEVLSDCKNLKKLYLGGNRIKDLAPLNSCSKLQELIIWNNPVSDLSTVRFLKNLTSLYCQEVDTDSYEFLSVLQKLKLLAVNGCSIKSLDELPQLENLNTLLISECQLQGFDGINKFPNLHFLDVGGNKISVVGRDIAARFDWLNESTANAIHRSDSGISLKLNSNPLEYPPYSVIELGEETIKNYYDATDEYGYAPLSEGRIIVIGDGSAGKSSLIEQILYGTFEHGKTQTNGIKIENWLLQHECGRDLTFHIWDFGGQEIQHAVHKFFFTEGCLYVLVLDNRKEEEPEYWLQQIESFAGGAPVLVVFNKHDENASEVADRKFLKEKYDNIIGFYNISCMTGHGVADFKEDLAKESVKLRTVNEQFPNNWFNIKKILSEQTSGEQHYISFDDFKSVCASNNVKDSDTQKLLLKYFTTIGAVTWFGDTYLSLLHVLSPAWITQGVYKIITSRKTAQLFGDISINHFEELLKASTPQDYVYDHNHFGYILGMMKKFDLCYTSDNQNILLPSAFGKMPKVEYAEFKGEGVRTYSLQFKDYMPMAIIHKFIAKTIQAAYDGNYWYSGIVIKDEMSGALAMVQADKEAKRIYVRIKGKSQLGVWEHIRREFKSIKNGYANIPYTELIMLGDSDATVSYEDLISHIKANKAVYFNPQLRKDFNVGYLMGMFESAQDTIEKFNSGGVYSPKHYEEEGDRAVEIASRILRNNSPVVHVNVSVSVNVEIVNKISSDVKGEVTYLQEQVGGSDKELADALSKLSDFIKDAKATQNSNDIKEKGWARNLKNVGETLAGASDKLKKIKDGGASAKAIFIGLKELTSHLNMHDVSTKMGEFYDAIKDMI